MAYIEQVVLTVALLCRSMNTNLLPFTSEILFSVYTIVFNPNEIGPCRLHRAAPGQAGRNTLVPPEGYKNTSLFQLDY